MTGSKSCTPHGTLSVLDEPLGTSATFFWNLRYATDATDFYEYLVTVQKIHYWLEFLENLPILVPVIPRRCAR